MGACLAARSMVSKSIGHSPRLYLPSRLFASIRGWFVICLRLVPSPADATFLAFLPAQTVEIDDHDNQATGNDPLPEGIHVQQIGAIVDRGQNEGA
jgi:hypothetical protein